MEVKVMNGDESHEMKGKFSNKPGRDRSRSGCGDTLVVGNCSGEFDLRSRREERTFKHLRAEDMN